jgi:hypothetical protein
MFMVNWLRPLGMFFIYNHSILSGKKNENLRFFFHFCQKFARIGEIFNSFGGLKVV